MGFFNILLGGAVLAIANDDMVADLDVEQASGLDEIAGDIEVRACLRSRVEV